MAATATPPAGFFETVSPHLISIVVIVVVIAALIGVHKLFLKAGRHDETGRIRKQATMLGLSLVGLIVIVMTLPIAAHEEDQLLTLLGLAVTVTLTLSSTTFVANMMAGLMLRSVGGLRPGCFIKIGDQFGRVTERGLFHVEIQTEDRDLCTLPNLYVVTNPVKVVSPTGTIVSAMVSLGYDTHHAKIEELLLRATEDSGLSDGFVQIIELGDFSVTYRAAGFLPKVKHLLTVRSKLRKAMLDALHGGGVEIVSPTFMNQRPLANDSKVIPHRRRAHKVDAEAASSTSAPEDVMFDKADEAEKIESLRERHATTKSEIEEIKAGMKEAKGDDEETARLQSRLERYERMLEVIEERIEAHEESANGGKK